MEIDIKDKEIINQTANFVRTYHSKQSKLPVVPGPDEEGLKMLERVYTIAKKYRQQEKENLCETTEELMTKYAMEKEQ